MADMFSNCPVFNGNVSGWNVSNVTNMSAMFANCYAFNQDISTWNVSNVTNMYYMLGNAISFSTANLNAIYNTWSTLPTLQNSVQFNPIVPCYSASAQTGRDILTSTYSWSISDGGVCP